MVTRTLSKSYGLAGMRFGFLIAQPAVIAELSKIKDSYNCDMISIAAATAAMNCQEWLADVVAKMNATRQAMAEKLAEMGFVVTPSHANFVWCQHPNADHQAIYEFLKSNQILVRYMDFEGWSGVAGKSAGLRISVGTDEQTTACLMMIKRYLDSVAS